MFFARFLTSAILKEESKQLFQLEKLSWVHVEKSKWFVIKFTLPEMANYCTDINQTINNIYILCQNARTERDASSGFKNVWRPAQHTTWFCVSRITKGLTCYVRFYVHNEVAPSKKICHRSCTFWHNTSLTIFFFVFSVFFNALFSITGNCLNYYLHVRTT